MTNSMSPEEIAEMSEDCQCSCKELEQLRADISEAYYLRDKAEGRYCTALGAIEQLHAAVKTAQELAARRLMEIDRLKKREKDLMDVIDSRDRALGFVPLDEVHASEPLEQPVATPGATFPGEDSVSLSAESSRPRELLAQQMEPDTSPLTHQEIFHAVHSLAADIVRLIAAVPARCAPGASRDASQGPNAWADAKGGLPDNKL